MKLFQDLYMKHEWKKVSRILLSFENASFKNLNVYSTKFVQTDSRHNPFQENHIQTIDTTTNECRQLFRELSLVSSVSLRLPFLRLY